MSDETKRYQCRHIFTDGHRCGSPCFRREEFCYCHHTYLRRVTSSAPSKNLHDFKIGDEAIANGA